MAARSSSMRKINTESAKPQRPFFRKTDLIFLMIGLLGAFLPWIGRWYRGPQTAHQAEIYHRNQLVKVLDLVETAADYTDEEIPDFIFSLDGEGGIRITAAPCPDQICVHTGWLRQPGDLAICVPEELLVKVVGASTKAPAVDLVIGEADTREKP